MDSLTPLIRPLSYDRICEIENRPNGRLALDEHFLRSPHRDVFFVFVEKVGCTFLKHVLVNEMIGDVSLLDSEYYSPGLQPINLIHALSHEALRVDGRDVLRSGSVRTISFCRNPYSRFVSAFVDKIQNPPNLELPYFCWIRREVLFKKARHAAQGNHVTFASEISIDEFADFVYSQAVDQRDKHWAEQCSLNLADKVKHQEVIPIERIGLELPRIWREYFGKDFVNRNYIKNSSGNSKPIITERLASKIYQIYKNDFDVFGYDIDSWRTV